MMPQQGRRQEGRLRTGLDARVITLDGTQLGRLLDISRHGARLNHLRAMRPGQQVVVQGPGFEVFGTVVWAYGDSCGLRFDRPLATAVLITLRDTASAHVPTTEREAARAAARSWARGWAAC